MPRDAAERLLRLARLLRVPVRYDPADLRDAYSPGSAITHRIDVRRFARQKQAALGAHRSQVNGSGRLSPAMRFLLRVPAPVFGALLGREWFIEAGKAPSRSQPPE
jgi:LmbE family N-acetylglucosaminyl deacetylase